MKQISMVFGGLLSAVLLVACESRKEMYATGGSRSDGTVEMSYQFGAFEKPIVDMAAAQAQAKQKCAAWGYTNAEPFGGEVRNCQVVDSNGICGQWNVKVAYQCLTKPGSNIN